MSNDDTQEPTGARLTEANARFLAARATDYQHYMDDLTETAALRAMRMLASDVLAFAADRAARVAEVAQMEADAESLQAHARLLIREKAALVAKVARLEAENDANERHLRLPLQRHIELLAAAEAQVDEMRPLVERIARGDFHEFYVSIFGDTRCIGCNATASTHIGFTHDDDCIVQAARVMVATWQTPAAPTPDADDEPMTYDTVFRQAFAAAWRTRGMSADAAHLLAREAADAWNAAPTPDGQGGK